MQTMRSGSRAPARRGPDTAALAEWSRRRGLLAAGMILLGAVLPLLKNSMLAGSVWVWPWQLLSPGATQRLAAAVATYTPVDSYAAYVLIPFLAAGVIAFLAHTMPLGFRFGGYLATGSAYLVVMLAGFPAQGQIFGLTFVPPTSAGALMVIVLLAAVATAATANRARKTEPAWRAMRIAGGVAGGVAALLFVLAVLAGEGPWAGWPVRLMCAAGAAYGVLAVGSAFRVDPGPGLARGASVLVRVLLVGLPVACLIAQTVTRDPFTTAIVGSGGGFANHLVSVVKSTALFLGGALPAAWGLAGLAALNAPSASPSPGTAGTRPRPRTPGPAPRRSRRPA